MVSRTDVQVIRSPCFQVRNPVTDDVILRYQSLSAAASSVDNSVFDAKTSSLVVQRKGERPFYGDYALTVTSSRARTLSLNRAFSYLSSDRLLFPKDRKDQSMDPLYTPSPSPAASQQQQQQQQQRAVVEQKQG